MHLADVKIHKNPQTINLKMTKNREKASRLKDFTFYEIFEVGQNFWSVIIWISVNCSSFRLGRVFFIVFDVILTVEHLKPGRQVLKKVIGTRDNFWMISYLIFEPKGDKYLNYST